MSDRPVTLEFIAEQQLRILSEMRLVRDDLGNIKVRMTGVEAEMGYVRMSLAELNGRMDRLDTRLDRIERRLDLVEDAT
jgi:hypothetical protein